MLQVGFCEKFEQLHFQIFAERGKTLPPFVQELLEWADGHAGQAGGISDMTVRHAAAAQTLDLESSPRP